MQSQFKLQYDCSQIETLANDYMEGAAGSGKTWRDADKEMEEAGARIRNAKGDYKWEDLLTIYKWKSPRKVGLFRQNSLEAIKNAFHKAFTSVPGDPAGAVAALASLEGVGVKMASAFLTAIFPSDFTVLDVRALEALGAKDASSLRLYLAYLAECKRLARQCNVSLRDLDRANWQWSKNKSNRKACC